MKRVVTVVAVLALAGVAAAAILSENGTSRSLGPASTHVITRGDLLVSVTEQGTLESSNNTEIKCRVRGDNVIISVIESGTIVESGDELLRLETLLIEEEINERTKGLTTHSRWTSPTWVHAPVSRPRFSRQSRLTLKEIQSEVWVEFYSTPFEFLHDALSSPHVLGHF